MNFKNILILVGFALLVVSLNVYAIDPSICNSGTNVVVHNNGSLKSCELKDEYEANSIRCSRGGASFYDNGRLESCQLSTPTTLGENKCDQSGAISFYPDGKLKSCKKSGD